MNTKNILTLCIAIAIAALFTMGLACTTIADPIYWEVEVSSYGASGGFLSTDIFYVEVADPQPIPPDGWPEPWVLDVGLSIYEVSGAGGVDPSALAQSMMADYIAEYWQASSGDFWYIRQPDNSNSYMVYGDASKLGADTWDIGTIIDIQSNSAYFFGEITGSAPAPAGEEGVPEPATVVGMVFAGLGMIARKRLLRRQS